MAVSDNTCDETDQLSWANDPSNAHNWSIAKKVYNSAVPSLLCILISFALAIYSPSHANVINQLHTGQVLSLLPFTLYVYGLAFGPAIAAPLSETFGRRFIYLLVTPVALLFILGAGLAKNTATLAICRLLAGIAISSPLAVGAGTIMDMWTGININRGVILLMTLAFLGPALGSLIGGWIAQYKNWPWSQWTTLFLGAATWIFALGAQETYAEPLMRQRAKRKGLPLPPPSVPRGLAGLRHLATVTLARPLAMLLREPIVLLCSLYSSLNFSVLFSFLASIPLIYSHDYDFTPGQAGLVFTGIATGCALGGLTLVLLDAHTLRLHLRRRIKTDPSPPERMLWGAMLGGPLMPVALFWFAWTARPGIHWVSSVLATGLFGFSNILIFVSTMLYLTNVYGAKYGASALSANGLLRYLIGGSFPLFTVASPLAQAMRIQDAMLTGAVYKNLTFPWASSLLGFIAFAFAFLPWVFYKYGLDARKHSSYVNG